MKGAPLLPNTSRFDANIGAVRVVDPHMKNPVNMYGFQRGVKNIKKHKSMNHRYLTQLTLEGTFY